MNPKYMSMIIPSRWMTGGKGLDSFREQMLKDKHISFLADYLSASECFPNVAIEGGVCYFVWKKDHHGKCLVETHYTNGEVRKSERFLSEDANDDILVRDEVALKILNKIRTKATVFFNSIVSTRMPFGIGNISVDETTEKPLGSHDYKIFMRDKNQRITRYIQNINISKNKELAESFKVFISKADGAAGQIGNPVPARIIGKGEIGDPYTICTETFLAIGPFKTKEESENCISYMKTKFFRFLVGIRKNKNMTQDTYKFVPLENLACPLTDEILYKKYDLDADEITYIETMIQEMN